MVLSMIDDTEDVDLDKVFLELDNVYEEYQSLFDKTDYHRCKRKYQEYCNKFSDAYLSGCYVYNMINTYGFEKVYIVYNLYHRN